MTCRKNLVGIPQILPTLAGKVLLIALASGKEYSIQMGKVQYVKKSVGTSLMSWENGKSLMFLIGDGSEVVDTRFP